ncbi:MAG: pentapeptide repeat-containing protein [Magnetococcales bacterium]|nr:pentapeptide repeat-containing protein [Magnetococcales bacterium]
MSEDKDKLSKSSGQPHPKEKGDRFENHIANLLSFLGYTLEREQLIDGNRVDLVARKLDDIDDSPFLVECKDHKEDISKEKIHLFKIWLDGDEAKGMHARGMFVARGFTYPARTAASKLNINTFTPDQLLEKRFQFKKYMADLVLQYSSDPVAKHYINQHVALEDRSGDEKTDLLPYAQQWSRGVVGKKLWLLLGDYGTGKSVFFNKLAAELAEKALSDPEAPKPLAIDLKKFPNATSLENLIQEALREERGWFGPPKLFLYLLEKGEIVLLLDAFDEMGAATIGRSVDSQFKALALASKTGQGRVLITSRTHFFKDTKQIESDYFRTGDDLSLLGKEARSYEAALDQLCYFSSDDVDRYLSTRINDKEQLKKAEEFIEKTSDLTELTRRPVLLEMIFKNLPDLMKENPERVTATMLYEKFTNQWLGQQTGVTNAKQRIALLEELAEKLWKDAKHQIHYRELLALVERKAGDLFPDELDPIKVDLEMRYAAFLTRDSHGNYRFSHRSFLEYFMARHLVRRWQHPKKSFRSVLSTASLSPELIQFFGDYLDTQIPWPDFLTEIKAILSETYQEKISENALRLALYLSRVDHIGPDETYRATNTPTERMQAFWPDRARLHGARLNDMDLSGAYLVNGHFSGANLMNTNLHGADLSGADFADTQLDFSNLNNSTAHKTNFRRASLIRASLCHGKFNNALFQKANLYYANGSSGCFESADFSHATLDSANLIKTDLKSACFNHAICTAVRFAWADLSDSQWNESQVKRCLTPHSINCPDALIESNQNGTLILQQGHSVTDLTGGVLRFNDQIYCTFGSDNRICFWDLTSGLLSRTLDVGRTHTLQCGDISPDGKYAVLGFDDGTAHIISIVDGALIHILKGHDDSVNSAAFSSDGNRVVTASYDSTARIFSAENGALIHMLKGHDGWVRSAAFSSDGNRVVTASSDSTARIFSAENGALIHMLKGHDHLVNSAAFSSDGNRVVTASYDSTARIFSAENGALIHMLKGHDDSVNSAAFSSDGNRVVTASDDRTARIFSAENGALIHMFKGHDHWVRSAVFSKDGKQILTASRDNTARLWDSEEGTEINCFKGHRAPITDARFITLDNRQLIQTASEDRTFIWWDIESGKMLKIVILAAGGGHLAIDNLTNERKVTWSGNGLNLCAFKNPNDTRMPPALWRAEDLEPERFVEIIQQQEHFLSLW